ncbi:hypothetical protein AAULH_14281 [Lactobacillus helveticus MTCC 5463]|nr:hypothetical protein AAULH_14281 [Lactobacillus helveticus MTCC 5463]
MEAVKVERERLLVQSDKLRQDLEDRAHDISREQRARTAAERMNKCWRNK